MSGPAIPSDFKVFLGGAGGDRANRILTACKDIGELSDIVRTHPSSDLLVMLAALAAAAAVHHHVTGDEAESSRCRNWLAVVGAELERRLA